MSVCNLGLTWVRLQASRHNIQSASLLWQQKRGIRRYKAATIRAMYWRGRSFDAVKYPDRRRDELQEWNYRSEIFAFSRRLQENLGEDTLRQIFAHPCYIRNLKLKESSLDLPTTQLESNESLVARGSELLDMTAKPYLRFFFNQMPEDGIIAVTNYLRSEIVMADIAKWIGCKDIILAAEWPPKPRVMADTVLALLAGIEKNLGFERVRRFVVDMIISYLNDKDILDDVWIIPNPKESLNQILENSGLPAYEPRIMFHTGIRTLDSCYVVGLYSNQRLLGSSPGETLAIAEECATLDVMMRLFDLRDSRQPFVYGEESEKIDYKSHEREHSYMKDWRIVSSNK